MWLAQRKKRPKYKNKAEGSEAGEINIFSENVTVIGEVSYCCCVTDSCWPQTPPQFRLKA